jgi:hypothetical protein
VTGAAVTFEESDDITLSGVEFAAIDADEA